jgi:hypothetical protein
MNDILIHGRDHVAEDAASGVHRRRPVTRNLHRGVYVTVISLAIWLILSVWLFAGTGVTDYLLFVVSGFIAVVVSLVLILSRVGHKAATSQADLPPWREWTQWDFEIGQGGDRSQLSSKQAAMQILLPIAAVAFGMTLFGVVLLVVERLSS